MSVNNENVEKKLDELSLNNELKKIPAKLENRQLNRIKPKLAPRPSRSMYVPVQKTYYGPKGTLKKVTDEFLMLVQDPISMQLEWRSKPNCVFLIKKECDTVFDSFNEILDYLTEVQGLTVYIEEKDHLNKNFSAVAKNREETAEKPGCIKKMFTSSMTNLNTDINNSCENAINKIDLIICLGGDGTILYASTLFQKSCPPVLAMNMGSLGFLCPFDFDQYKEYVKSILKGDVPLLLRNRLSCTFEKSISPSNSLMSEQDANETSDDHTRTHSQPSISLNEIVVGRGPSPFLSNLDLFINDYLITTVQGDGIIISSPTGSTAYAMAAGASMSHPSVPSIIIAPICPHSLSFRPIVVPATVDLKITLAKDARHTAWFCVDGRANTELKHGYQINITTSEYPLPSICRSDQLNDWFEGLANCLHWNDRQKQLPLNNCYTEKSASSSRSFSVNKNESSN